MQSHWKIKTFVLLICLLIGSCSQVSESTTAFTPGLSATMIKTSQVSFQVTSTPVVVPTMTFVPTLPAAEAEKKVIELLSNNGNCRLPCFWGFTPGKTNFGTIFSFFALFHPFGGGTQLNIIKGDVTLATTIILGSSNPTSSKILRRLDVMLDAYRGQRDANEFVHTSPFYAQYFRYYTLPYLLSTYGPPENVYISPQTDISPYEYYLVLDYTKSGWVAYLHMPLLHTVSGDVLMGCPADAFTNLILWSPDDAESASQYGYANGPPEASSMPIEKATSLTLDQFYQQYKDPTNTKCLETPTNTQP